MALPEIIILGCFSKELNCTIPAELIHDLSELKFDGEDESNFREYLCQVIHIFLCNRVESEYVMARLVNLTFEGRVKKWFHTLPIASIHLTA